eukprot:scaffold65675_cov85-Phaeocystis_antarctica.AAC.9
MLTLWQDNVGVRNGTQRTVVAELAHAPQPPARALGGGAGLARQARCSPPGVVAHLQQLCGEEKKHGT